MKISVTNYGPIAEAKDIEVRPLTVFSGPSDTGKSYLAILIHAWFQTLGYGGFIMERLYPLMNTRPMRKSNFDENIDDAIIKHVDTVLTKIDAGEIQDIKFNDLPTPLQDWVQVELANYVNKKFHLEMCRYMGISGDTNDVIGEQFQLKVADEEKNITIGSPNTSSSSMTIKNISIAEDFPRRLLRQEKVPRYSTASIFLSEIFESMLHYLKHPESFYLPAARTGLMQSHLAISSSLIQRASHTNPEASSSPTLSGIISDFLQEIISVDANKIPDKEVSTIADYMEQNILHGQICIDNANGNQYPKFLYKQNELEIPLMRTSSMVTELAPIVLFARHRIRENYLLIIEEPEAHLHPEAQIGMAEVIARFVQVGVKVLVTTHSDYFLEKIENHVRTAQLKKTGMVALPEEKVAVYTFNKTKTGTVVKELPFDMENGYAPSDHAVQSSNLYNETVELLDAHDRETES